MPNVIDYGGNDEWKKKATELLNQGGGGGGGLVDDVIVYDEDHPTGQSVVNEDKEAEINLTSYAKSSDVPSTAEDVGAIPVSEKGANSGVAELDANGKVPSSQLPSYVDDVIEVSDYASLPSTGETGKIYVTLDDNKTYRWSGSAYVEISPSLALGETSSTAYRGDRGKTAYDHATESGRASTTASGLYKIGVTAEGHVASATLVQKSDITDLGIPAQDTTYTASGNIEIDGNVIKRKEVWLDSFAEYEALQSVDSNTDYHVPSVTFGLLPITVVNGKICCHYTKEVT